MLNLNLIVFVTAEHASEASMAVTKHWNPRNTPNRFAAIKRFRISDFYRIWY